MDSSGPIAQEESPVTAPNNLNTQQVIAASQDINSVELRNAPSTVMMDRRVPVSKYLSIAPTSTEIAKKTSVSTKDKTFDNIEMLDKALRASNLLSLADGSRKPPEVNDSNCSAEAIKPTIKADGSSSLTVIGEDDYYKYFADSIVAYTFMLSMINVRQSNIQLTCYKYHGNSVKSRLRCSLLNCNYTLLVLQRVATND